LESHSGFRCFNETFTHSRTRPSSETGYTRADPSFLHLPEQELDRILLLFDIDGTLMRCGGAGMRAMFHVADQMFGQDFKWEGIEAAGNLDPLIFSQAEQINQLPSCETRHRQFHDAYIQRLAHEFQISGGKVEIMPGVHMILEQLRVREQQRQDIQLGLLTGNYAQAVPIKLQAIGVDHRWFGIHAFGDEAPSRPALVELAMRKYEASLGHKADPRGVIVIGDTPRDVACAKAHDAKVLAVATGGYTMDQLSQCGADRTVENLLDPSPLLQMIDQARQDITHRAG
jgi:phosphoglycolate phosphatase